MLPRTIELGTYLGIRDQGALVAMAGTRMHLDGFTEISAVCTDDEHRGRGLAKLLVARLVDEILGRGEVACLHVVTTNTPAIRLYESLGFTTRREMDFALLHAPAERATAQYRLRSGSETPSHSRCAVRTVSVIHRVASLCSITSASNGPPMS